MRSKRTVSAHLGLLSVFAVFTQLASAQAPVANRIVAPVVETQWTILKGNTHPLARAEFDQGPAPASLEMDHILLVLKRAPEQEAALESLLAQQQDRSSPNYHRWLSPESFGRQFGSSDQDVQTITAWLASHGFQNIQVSSGRTVIDFSGTAGQVQQAFRTAIHRYVVKGQQHWANATDPQIPTALAPVVAGVNTLHDFRKKPASHPVGVFRKSRATGAIASVHAAFSFGGGCNGTGTNCFALGPYDFATIYNVLPLWNAGVNGNGQAIAIVSDSDVSSSDVATFRSLFGLPAATFNQIETGADPGILSCVTGGDECEAIVDAEWSGAVAPGATLDLVVSPSTNSAFGGDTSAVYIINNYNNTNIFNPAPHILSYSYDACELVLGTAGNQFYNAQWQQAAAEGITVAVAASDNGSADCDGPTGAPVQPAVYGLAVNGVASTPYNVAVGGTDFNDFTLSSANTYWNAANTVNTLASAKGYIPETTYNDSCTNALVYSTLFGFPGPEPACNNGSAESDGFVIVAGGGGGASNCTISDGANRSSCSGGYTKPTWQSAPGVPNDGKRDIPDLSFFAGDGFIQSFYMVCEADADQDGSDAPCSLGSPFLDFEGVGGTSVSVQAFAGLMALLDQETGSAQGNANPQFYALAAEQSASSCSSSSLGLATTPCSFYDVTSGSIAAPCARGSANCNVTFASDSIGVLSGYAAGTGYDLATGLGSVNAANLVNRWGPNFYLSSANPVVTVPSAGSAGMMSVTATALNGFTGNVSFSCSGLPAGATCGFVPASLGLSSGTPTASTTVTVTTMAAMANRRARPDGPGLRFLLFVLSLACLLGTAQVVAFRRHRRHAWGAAFALLILGLALTMAGCGSGSSSGGSSGGSTVATLNATSGGIAYSMNFTVTVQ